MQLKLLFGLLFLTCFGIQSKAETITLTGAGATLPFPLYSTLFKEYEKLTGNKVNYQSIGSGGGIVQLRDRTIDFGATDAYAGQDELSCFKLPIFHIPIVVGSVAIGFNLQGVSELNMTGLILAGIYTGQIKYWDNPAIVALNPNVDLPHERIIPIRRADGSGTTYIFSDYLSKKSPDWKKVIGKGKSIKWPVGIGAKGNSGVTKLIQQMKGSIGYMSLPYAKKNNITTVKMLNNNGQFIKPTLESTIKSAKIDLPEDSRISITDTNVKDAYPITGLTWILIYQKPNEVGISKEKATVLNHLLEWMLTEGQVYADSLYYAPLPVQLLAPTLKRLSLVTYDNIPLN